EKIATYCKEKNIILIEDLAHSIGTVYASGKEAGMVGDFVTLSFSQDKMIDGISGGALIIRNQGSRIKDQEFIFETLSSKQQIIDRLYPLFTLIIRKTYLFGVGKFLHFVLKRFKLLSSPMSDNRAVHSLPAWYCSLIYDELSNLGKNLIHRKKIAAIYADQLRGNLVADFIKKKSTFSTNVRFPIMYNGRVGLIKELKNHAVFVSDIWYDSPIAPKKYVHLSNYNHQCPQADDVSEKMLNLPTHRNISENEAKYLAKIVNDWMDKSSSNES
ncbi:MAG TPA: DegT/DnrJ/EryC1/StrS family aminotransferase, partial [Patescibacteria group bacterium]|nr:DegT/DnrJ/EryC1/StrS family aminotransferase [Patescibacteria group bacterium]